MDGRNGLVDDCLLRFVQVFLQIGHEGSPAGPDGGGVARVGLMLAVNVTVGIADMDLAELREEIDAGAIGGPELGGAELPVTDIAREQRPTQVVCGLLQSL